MQIEGGVRGRGTRTRQRLTSEHPARNCWGSSTSARIAVDVTAAAAAAAAANWLAVDVPTTASSRLVIKAGAPAAEIQDYEARYKQATVRADVVLKATCFCAAKAGAKTTVSSL